MAEHLNRTECLPGSSPERRVSTLHEDLGAIRSDFAEIRADLRELKREIEIQFERIDRRFDELLARFVALREHIDRSVDESEQRHAERMASLKQALADFGCPVREIEEAARRAN